MPSSRPWLRNRLGFTPFFLVPIGWQGEFTPGWTLPKGVDLPGDPTMTRPTTDWNRVTLTWQHQAVLRLPKPMAGYLCYRFAGGQWRIRVRDIAMTEFHAFKVNLSQQATDLAFVDEGGNEVVPEIVEACVAVGDERYAHLPTY
jgi:hypothetical protein